MRIDRLNQHAPQRSQPEVGDALLRQKRVGARLCGNAALTHGLRSLKWRQSMNQ